MEDAVEKNCHYVIKKLPRDWCDTENQNAAEEDMTNSHPQDIVVGRELETEVVDGGWIRDDIPLTQVPVPSP